ncbi:MAG: alpha/beta hydrolase [Bacteroidetes bacterium]|nr:MAG: alpha/beta hydrolase [Bacteroidota bacterium]
MSHFFISIDGVNLHVTEAGTGTPLLFIHGLGGPLMWQKVVEPLSIRFRVIVPALPGFGESESASRMYTVQEHAGILKQVLQKLGIERASVVGISYGGQVAATLARFHPTFVERLVLVCCTGLMKAPLIVSNPLLRVFFSFIAKRFLLTNEKRLCKKGERSFYNLTNRPHDLCRKFYEQLMKPGHRDAWLNAARNSFFGGEGFKRLLSTISTPTLILWGENDNTVPPEHATEFHRLIPGSRVHLFKECAHSIPLEKPEEFCGVVREFIAL